MARSTALEEALSGVLGGVFSVSLIQPLDVVKTRLQVPRSPYAGTVDALRTIVRDEGVSALYAGLATEYVKSATQNGMYFFSYATLKRLYRQHMLKERNGRPTAQAGARERERERELEDVEKAKGLADSATGGSDRDGTAVVGARSSEKPEEALIPFFANLAIGCLAGACSQLVVNPINVINTRVVTRAGSAGFFATLAETLKEEGVGALYRGLGPSLILTLNPAIQVLVFDRLLRYLKRTRAKDRSPTAWELFLIGAIAKAVATVVTYPLILSKTRLQASSQFSSSLHVIVHTARTDGFFGLYAGLQAQAVKSVAGAALMFMAKGKVAEFAAKVVQWAREQQKR